MEEPDTNPVTTPFNWHHLSQAELDTQSWLKTNLDLSEEEISALCDELTRPRVLFTKNGELICILRTIYTEADDTFSMVSIRCFVSREQIVSLSQYQIDFFHQLERLSVRDITSADFFYNLCELSSNRITNKIVEMDEKAHCLHDMWDDNESIELNNILKIRKQISHIQRFLLSQADVFLKLAQYFNSHRKNEDQTMTSSWRELNNATHRDIEALTEIRERLQILQDAIMQKREETHNKILFLMSLVSTVFLPLTFIASLLGMNVSGIPLQTGSDGFWILCGFLCFIALLELALFRLWKWIK
ncbi:hypothetical protein D5018_19515 [Parashewanella curva]|uniref:Zinc transporter ZntB n=1 Tax=Parashewanella curva TaxID=2338552 RepID=A0A3L8PRI8_9GAMM|nr:CorA family divalent cation transporter [Parashewanella curva]RLV58011.1 hypothetical protein D5018_19515 [Parashewanella curva]